jgi:hypothetical protein
MSAAEPEDRSVVVEAEENELASAYGAPPDLSHGRISTLTKSYVLSPFSFELETGYDGSYFRDDVPAHIFSDEIEMGLPARFTIGARNEAIHYRGDTRERVFTLEGRYALADWNKLPFNPAIAAEYRFGFDRNLPDSGELALLVSHDFPHLIEWAANIFVDHDFGRGDSWGGGIAQSIEVPIILPDEKLEAGVEMQYRSNAEPVGAAQSIKGLLIGPTLAWRPSKTARLDLSPLFGCSDHAPAMELFAIVSFSFGGPDEHDVETPASARGR